MRKVFYLQSSVLTLLLLVYVHLGVIESRRVWCAAGFRPIEDYCVRKLRQQTSFSTAKKRCGRFRSKLFIIRTWQKQRSFEKFIKVFLGSDVKDAKIQVWVNGRIMEDFRLHTKRVFWPDNDMNSMYQSRLPVFGMLRHPFFKLYETYQDVYQQSDDSWMENFANNDYLKKRGNGCLSIQAKSPYHWHYSGCAEKHTVFCIKRQYRSRG